MSPVFTVCPCFTEDTLNWCGVVALHVDTRNAGDLVGEIIQCGRTEVEEPPYTHSNIAVRLVGNIGLYGTLTVSSFLLDMGHLPIFKVFHQFD